MSDPTPASSPAIPPPAGEFRFPFGLWSTLFTVLTLIAFFNVARVWRFYWIKEPIVVRSAADASVLKGNEPVEVHLPLDFDSGVAFDFTDGSKFIAVPFEGTEQRLIFVTRVEQTLESLRELVPPFRGRSEAENFGGQWKIGDDKEVDLERAFGKKIPDDTIVFRTDTADVMVWGAAALGVVFLLVKLHQIYLWDKYRRSIHPGRSSPPDVHHHS